MKKYLISWIDKENHPKSIIVHGEMGNSEFKSKIEISSLEIRSDVNMYLMGSNLADQFLHEGTIKGTVNSVSPLQITISNNSVESSEPISSRVQSRIPDANEFLKSYNKNNSEKFIRSDGDYNLMTTVGSVQQSQRVKLVVSDQIEIQLPYMCVTRKHLQYTKVVSLSQVNGKNNEQLEGYVSKIRDFQDQNISKITIIPQKYHYGLSNPLESHKFENTGDISTLGIALERIWLNTKYWFNALRSQQYFITLMSIIFALLLVRDQVNVIDSFFKIILIVVGTYTIQSGGNLLNDYFDHKSELDDINILSISETSQTKFIQSRLIHPTLNISIGLFLFMIGSSIGLYLNYMSPGNVILLLGIVGAITTYFYTGEPLKLVYRGVGELILALNFGPLIIIGTQIVILDQYSLDHNLLLSSLPPLFFITGLLILNEVDDIPADRLLDKKTAAVRIGKRISLLIAVIFVIISFIYSYFIGLFDNLIAFIIGGVLSIGIAMYSIKASYQSDDQSPNLRLFAIVYPLWIIAMLL